MHPPPPAPFAADYAAQANAAAAATPFAVDYAAQANPFAAEYAAEAKAMATEPFAAEYAAEAKATRAAQMENIGLAMGIAGAISSIFGAVFSAGVAKEQAQAQARMLEHESFMSNMNARRAERNAGAIMQQGRAAIATATAEAGQRKASQRTSAAGRGVVIDQGSARDVTDTTEIVKEVQRVAINREAVARAGDANIAATNLRNQSLLSSVGAGSMRSAASRISPLSSGAAQFISSTGGFLRDQAAYMRRS